jgi:hypothetical protein
MCNHKQPDMAVTMARQAMEAMAAACDAALREIGEALDNGDTGRAQALIVKVRQRLQGMPPTSP